MAARPASGGAPQGGSGASTPASAATPTGGTAAPTAPAAADWDAALDAPASTGPGGSGGGSTGGAFAPYRSVLSGVSDSTSTEEILLLLKKRLEHLYRATEQ